MGSPENDFQPLKRPLSHDIDEQAKAVFNAVLPPSWIRNPFNSDYGKDYHVEITEKTAVRDKVFYVQLKATASPRYSKGRRIISHSLEYKYSQHVHDEVKLPVFLVVVDTNTKKAYWLFMQEYLKQPKHKTWRKQKSFTYRIPTTNCLSDVKTFEREIGRAVHFMRATSISLQEKVAFDTEQLQLKDKRVKVLPNITPDAAEFRIVPLEPVTLIMRVTGKDPKTVEKFKQIFEEGEPVSFDAGELQILGSPLFEGIYEEGGAIQVTRMTAASATVIVYDDKDREVVRVGDIRGTWRCVKKDLYFKSEERMPFSIELGPMKPPEGDKVGSTDTTFRLNPRRWLGQPILQASYFDRIDGLFMAIAKHGRLGLEFSSENGKTVRFRITSVDFRVFPFLGLLEMMRKARKVAELCKVDPVFKEEDFTNDDKLTEINAIYGLLVNGTYEYPQVELEVTLSKHELMAHTFDQSHKSHHLLLRAFGKNDGLA